VEESVEESQFTVFKGTYRHRIDPKGRLPVPAAFRRTLDEGRVVVTRLDQCLAAYSPAEWSRLEAQLAALPAFNRQVKSLSRLLTSRACDCELDGQGRILLPAALRVEAGLGREAVVVGVLNRFEVWNPENWGTFLRESERLLDDVTLDVQWPPAPGPPRALSPLEPQPAGQHPQGKPSR
jgi:MraZ protein